MSYTGHVALEREPSYVFEWTDNQRLGMTPEQLAVLDRPYLTATRQEARDAIARLGSNTTRHIKGADFDHFQSVAGGLYVIYAEDLHLHYSARWILLACAARGIVVVVVQDGAS